MGTSHIDVVHRLEHHVTVGIVNLPQAEFVSPFRKIPKDLGLLLFAEVLILKDILLTFSCIVIREPGYHGKTILSIVAEQAFDIILISIKWIEKTLILIGCDMAQDIIDHACQLLTHPRRSLVIPGR